MIGPFCHAGLLFIVADATSRMIGPLYQDCRLAIAMAYTMSVLVIIVTVVAVLGQCSLSL